MYYLVLNVTNWGDGFETGGIFKSYKRACKRCEYLQNHYEKEFEDSWRVVEVKTQNITDPPFEEIDGYADIAPKKKG